MAGPHRTTGAGGGDVDLAAIGVLLAEPARARMLQALLDGRALPAGLLASEAGVAASTASAHLSRLLDGGFLDVEQHGRHRYYRLTSGEVADALEKLAGLAPIAPVRSLRDDSRARALRQARTCYDHLAGRLGVAVMGSLLRLGVLTGHDGTFRPGTEQLAARGPDTCYQLTGRGGDFLRDLGLRIGSGSRRPLVRHCVDWSEQRHHLSGGLGAALTSHMFEAGWLERSRVRRAVTVTDLGADQLHRVFCIDATSYR